MAVVAFVGLCLLMLVIPKGIYGKPFWGGMLCDLFCDDSDDSSSSSSEDMMEYIFDPCSGCTSNTPKDDETTSKPSLKPLQQPFNVMLAPSPVGLNLTLRNDDDSWVLGFQPWTPGPSTTAAATTAAPTSAGTTAAPENATTAAP